MKALEKVIEYKFQDESWLETALTHKSYANEKRLKKNNEKLEFVGDAVLGLVMAEELFKLFPKDDEGGLSKKRASLVNETILSELALELKLNEHIKLGRGENQGGSEIRPRLLASAVEALVGAVYLDGGYDAGRNMILKLFEKRLHDPNLALNYESDFKSRLQEETQKKIKETPTYKVLEEKGPPHDRIFVVEVSLQGKALAVGEGRSKKEAEQMAAEKALQNLGEEA